MLILGFFVLVHRVESVDVGEIYHFTEIGTVHASWIDSHIL